MYCAHEIRTWSRLDAKCSSFVATICSFPAGFLTKPKICYLKIDASCARCHHLRMQNTQYRTSKVRYPPATKIKSSENLGKVIAPVTENDLRHFIKLSRSRLPHKTTLHATLHAFSTSFATQTVLYHVVLINDGCGQQTHLHSQTTKLNKNPSLRSLREKKRTSAHGKTAPGQSACAP